MKAYREAEGWKFYYSPEGYPYFFNDLTGISEWATQDTYFMSISDEQSQLWNEENDDNYNDKKKKKETLANENLESPEEDEEENAEEDEDNEDEESRSSSLDENLEKKFKQFLNTPEGIAAVLEEQDRIMKYIEKTEKQNQQKRETQYLKSLFVTKKYDGDELSAKNSGNSVWNATMSATWSWLTEKPPDQAANNRENKTQRLKRSAAGQNDNYGRETVHRMKQNGSVQESNDLEDGSNRDEGAEIDETNEDNSNDEDNDEISLSSDDSDVEVLKSPLFSELPAWVSWQSVKSNLVQPSSQYLNDLLASVMPNRENVIEEESSSRNNFIQNVSQNAWDFTVAAAIATGKVFYYAIVGICVRLEPYLIQFMEQVIDINHNGAQNNSLRRRIENLSLRPSERGSSNVDTTYNEVGHPSLPATSRPDDLSFSPNDIQSIRTSSILTVESRNSDQIIAMTNDEEATSVEQVEYHLHSTEVTSDDSNVKDDSSGWKVIVTEDETQCQQSSPDDCSTLVSDDKNVKSTSLQKDTSTPLSDALQMETSKL